MNDLNGIDRKSENETVLENVNGGAAQEGPADLGTILSSTSGNRKENPGGNEDIFRK